MARKFTTARQNDVFLNEELHDLFMSLKYINNGSTMPSQDKQSPIPVGAIWNDRSKGQNIIKVNSSGTEWDPAFEGYYHPANLREKPLNPVNGQIWINEEKDNVLHMYDSNTNAWIAVKALTTTSSNVLVDLHSNYMHMTSLKDMDTVEEQKTFLVPYETAGKLFDNGIYIHPNSESYEASSEISATYKTISTNNNESWVHVNPNKIYTIEKRLIKIKKDGSTPYKIYGVFDSNTEFYILDSATGLGTILLPYKTGMTSHDYTSFDKGIELISDRAKNADYLYTISYAFYDTARPGKLVKSSFTIGADAQVYVGQLTKRPLIFLDGLYLEQSKYNYDSETGRVDINDTIINSMDMMAVVFQDIEATGEKALKNITGPDNDTRVGTFTNAAKFKKPLAFVSGVMGTNIFTPEEISFVGTSLVIKNFGPGVIDPVKVMVVEADNMYLCHGTIDSTNTIKHPNITNSLLDEYILFIDGVLISSRHLDVSEGEVRVANAIKGQQYVLLKIQDDSTTALSFDSKIMNYTVAIQNEDGTLYNECNNALIYADGKLIPMEDALYKDKLPVKGATGQIVKVKSSTSDNVYDMYLWNDDIAKWEIISDSVAIQKIESLILGAFSSGSIMLNATDLTDKNGTYYAYTFANSVEEPLLKGERILEKGRNEYSVNVEHNFASKQGALSAYINGLLNFEVVENNSNNGKFTVPTLVADEGIDPYNDSRLIYYIEKPEKKELISCVREVLTAANRNTEYENAYNTNISLLPGVVSVYINGVRLEKENYSIINANTIILHLDIVGSQKNYDPNNKSTWNKYMVYDKNGNYEIDCYRDDHILIEVREDYDLKSQTISVRYGGQRTFYMEDDGIPKSLILTQDLIKIYIDGVLYNGEYIINKDSYSITLLDSELEFILNTDPIARYFELHPSEHDEYIKNNGSAYVAKPKTNRITFEWR